MSQLLDADNLDRNPHNVAPDAWYYEGVKGLDVYYKSEVVAFIPVRSIRAYLRRLDAAKRPPARRKGKRQ